MKQAKLLMDLGTKATYFGLGLLAAKKLRPYAKYFIAGGVAVTAVPGVMMVMEQVKAKKANQAPAVEEVTPVEVTACCQPECTECSEDNSECCHEAGCDCATEEAASESTQPCCCQEASPEN
jgi:hypothetical protein